MNSKRKQKNKRRMLDDNTKKNSLKQKRNEEDLDESPPLVSKIEPSHHPSPPPSIQRVVSFSPSKYQLQQSASRMQSSTGNHQSEPPTTTCLAKHDQYKKTSKEFTDDLCSNTDSPRGRRGGEVVKVGMKLESRMLRLSEIFSSPYGHDQAVVHNISQHQQQQEEIERKKKHDHAGGGSPCKKGFLKIAKESISFFTEEIKDLEKEGFFFCVGGGCGDDDDMADDDIKYDADDMRTINETFMSTVL